MSAARAGGRAGAAAVSGPGTPVVETPGPEANGATGPGLRADQLPAVISGLSRQNSVYRQTMAVCDKVASAAVQGADTGELTRIFAELTEKTVVLLDPEFRSLAQAGSDEALDTVQRWNPEDASIARLFRVLAAERRPLRVPAVPGSALAYGCLAMPVIVGDALLGYLLVLGETVSEADDVDLIVTSSAATIFALTMAREKTSMELGLRYQSAIVDSLVSGHFLDTQDAHRKAQILGIPDGQAYRVAVARVSNEQAPAGLGRAWDDDMAEGLLTRLAESLRCAVVVRGPELVMILPEQAAEDNPGGTVRARAGTRAPAIEQLCQHAGDGRLTCGLSEATRLPESAPQALLQAEQAIDLGIRIGRAGQAISYEELGIYRLLLRIGEMHQLWEFAEDVLGPLMEYDARHKLDLIGTLSVYLSQHESLKQTARVLRVHVNTVSYRIQRIEKLTSLDLADPDDRLSAHVATKIIESQLAGDGQQPSM